MKTIAILQPSFLPWIGYFDQINKSDVFVLYDDVQYDKNGWRNRNKIKNLNGKEHWLTVPVVTKNKGFPMIKDVKIDETKKWRKQHLGTLRQFYKEAPFFDEVYPMIEPIYSHKRQVYLVEIINEVLAIMLEYLGIKTKIVWSSELGVEKSDKVQRIVDIVNLFSGKKYISGNAASSYMSAEDLGKHDILLEWHDYSHPNYTQINGDFLSHLSIIDLLFNEGGRSLEILAGAAN